MLLESKRVRISANPHDSNGQIKESSSLARDHFLGAGQTEDNHQDGAEESFGNNLVF